jgi:hypothetical protein
MSGDKDGKSPACDKVREDLDAHLDGELAVEAAVELEAHLASCAACRAELGRRRKLVALVQALPRPKAPAGLAEKIVAASRPGRPDLIVKLRTWAPALATAAVLFLALVIGLNAPSEDRGPAEMARDAEIPAATSAAAPAPSAEVAGKAVAPRVALADAEEKLDEMATPGVAFDVALRKGADPAGPGVSSAREVEREADHALVEAPPADDGVLRFEAKGSAPAEERAVAAEHTAPARSRSKDGGPMVRARSARRATGGRYQPERSDDAAMATTTRTEEDILGRREDFDPEQVAEKAPSGRAVVVPQVHRIPRQRAVGAEDEGSRTGRVVLSRVAGSRAAVAEGGGIVATIPLATPDPMATQVLIVDMARQIGGEFVKGIPVRGPAGGRFALATKKGKSGRAASPGRRSRPDGDPVPVASNVAPFTARPRDDTIIVRLPGAGAEVFLRRIDERFGEVETRFVAVLEEEARVDGGQKRLVYREVRSGSVLEKLPPFREFAEVTVKFPLMSLAEAEEIEAADAVEAAEAARAARAEAAPASETPLDEAASEQAEPAETQARPAAY